MSDETAPSGAPGKEMFSDFVQIGVIVRDLDRTVKVLSEVFGLGPFRTIMWPPPDRADFERIHRGEPSDFTLRVAFTELGPIELEIVQPLTGKSAHSEFLDEHGEGIQHIRFNVPDMEPVIESLAAHGIEPVMSGSGLRPGTVWVHFDTSDKVGFTIEVMNVLAGVEGRTPEIVDGKVQI